MPSFESKVRISGELAAIEMMEMKEENGRKPEPMSRIEINYMGGSFQFFNMIDLHGDLAKTEVGTPVVITCQVEPDPNAKGNNKFKVAKGTARVERAKA